MPSLYDVVRRLEDVLSRAGIDHAFGGALALAAAGLIRGTVDIDINVFADEPAWGKLLSSLEACGAVVDPIASMRRLSERADLQVIVEGYRVDVFTPFDPFHESVRLRVRQAPLEGRFIPVISGEDLVIFKILFDRPKDWLDLRGLFSLRGSELDRGYVRRWLDQLLDSGDPRHARLAAILVETSERA